MPKRKREAGLDEGREDARPDQSLLDALPGITRKVTACAACRKNKIKCDMPEDGPPCVRCRRRSLSCVLNRSLQSLVEDTRNLQLIQSDISRLHGMLETVCDRLGLEGPKPLASVSKDSNSRPVDTDQDAPHSLIEGCEVSPPESPSVHAPIDTFLDIKIRSPNSLESPSGTRFDLVTKGIISVTVAEQLVHQYFSRLDQYLYGVAGENPGLEALRSDAPILLAAICTVSALHSPQDQVVYEACNREFRSLVTKSTFEKRDIEYIRALCISSFWLANASRILCTDAIRRAADMRLQRSFDALFAEETSSDSLKLATDRARVWYLLFVCDQHLSILYNRDSLLRSDKAIAAGWESYLYRVEATQSDVRIMSQVSLLLIMSQVRDVLGCDDQRLLSPNVAGQILSYTRQLDKWYAQFSRMFEANPALGEFPRRGLQMHYQFGKLYLGQQVFKGLHGRAIPLQLLSAAGMAHDAAAGIFEMILTERELQEGLVGMPHYFHVMLAFAGHLLLEICQNYHEQLSVKLEEDFQLISSALSLFRNTHCIPQHPLSRMTLGLNRKLSECAAILQIPIPVAVPTPTTSDIQPAMDDFRLPVDLPLQSADLDELLFADFGEFNFPGLTGNPL